MAQAQAQPQTHWVIVALETFFCPLPDFTLPAPHTCEFRNYDRTRPDQIAERIRDADIVIMTILPMTAEVLSAEASPRLKSTMPHTWLPKCECIIGP